MHQVKVQKEMFVTPLGNTYRHVKNVTQPETQEE